MRLMSVSFYGFDRLPVPVCGTDLYPQIQTLSGK
jgi:hypothetical protein